MPCRGRAVLLGALVATACLILACDADSSDGPVGAFYLEAQISVTTPAGDSAGTDALRGGTSTGLRWWVRDGSHFRYEFYDPSAMLEWGPRWTVADGEDAVYFDPRTGSFQRFPLDESGLGIYPTSTAPIGPLWAETVDELIEQSRDRVDYIERVGTEEFLGRPVEVIEFGPTWSSGSDGGGGAGEQAGGVGRYYVDAESNFVLRYTVDGGDEAQSIDAEVTLLDLDPAFEGGEFEVDLPSGAVEISDPDGSCSSSGSGGAGPSLDVGVSFRHLPAGWSDASSGSSHGTGCEPIERWSSLRRPNDGLIVATVRTVPPTGIPPVRRDATPVGLGGVEAHHLTEGDIERLVWVDDNVIVTLEARGLPLDELLRIAASAE